MDNILELHQVCKTFPKTNFTLDHVSFSIPYGSIMGFVGENGAGKTTTIGCVLNTVSKDSGTIKIFGKELADTDTELKEKIGVVYDGDNFPAYWTAGCSDPHRLSPGRPAREYGCAPRCPLVSPGLAGCPRWN